MDDNDIVSENDEDEVDTNDNDSTIESPEESDVESDMTCCKSLSLNCLSKHTSGGTCLKTSNSVFANKYCWTMLYDFSCK